MTELFNLMCQAACNPSNIISRNSFINNMSGMYINMYMYVLLQLL